MKLEFKITFPTGYQINDSLNDNIDINVVLDNGKVYFATLFTPTNTKLLMEKDNDVYFWADSMILVYDLQRVTIRETIGRILMDGYGQVALSDIGNIESVYGEGKTYLNILDMT